MTDFFRFPRTPHLAWLGDSPPRGDKVLDAHETRELLAHDVVVEEKVDGANLGLSVDDDGVLRAQNRGHYLSFDNAHGQWQPLKRWLEPRKAELEEALYPDLMLFGEWCYAVHSIRYSHLPDWFLAFDIYDRARGEFWSTEGRDALASRLGLAVVPRLAAGKFDLLQLEELLDNSRLTDGPAEGLYVRLETAERLQARAKLVRREFVQSIERHWSKGPLQTNALDVTREPYQR
ncbi:MAG TPA: RNA ligase family protein [Labilithrix sp.]|nr:RNA ligase family protein [Labilithrix sp.]